MIFLKACTIFQKCPKSLRENWVFRPFCLNYAVIGKNWSGTHQTRIEIKFHKKPQNYTSHFLDLHEWPTQGLNSKVSFKNWQKHLFLSNANFFRCQEMPLFKIKSPIFWKTDLLFSTSRLFSKSKAFPFSLFHNFMPKRPDDGNDIQRFPFSGCHAVAAILDFQANQSFTHGTMYID